MSAQSDRRLLDAAASELGFDSAGLDDRALAFAVLAAFGVAIDRTQVGPQFPTPLRQASTAHLVARARILVQTQPIEAP